jgi:hypothetical protein
MFEQRKMLSWGSDPQANDCRANHQRNRGTAKARRERLVQRMRELGSREIPQDFIEAFEDFEKERFVSMETALNETPRARELSRCLT